MITLPLKKILMMMRLAPSQLLHANKDFGKEARITSNSSPTGSNGRGDQSSTSIKTISALLVQPKFPGHQETINPSVFKSIVGKFSR